MIEKIESIKKFNFWETRPQTGYKRSVYLKRLQKSRDSNLVKVLVGQRRVGKSFVLRQVIDSLIDTGVDAKRTLYINKEYTEYDFIRNYEDLIELVNVFTEKLPENELFYLFVDEIQNIQNWEKAINSLSQDFTRRISIFITGSNAQLLSGELATYLSGRYIKFLILPFSFSEYAGITKKETNKATYLEFLQSGGLPELFHLPDDESKRQYLSAIYDTVILRDVLQRHHLRDVSLLKDIFAFIVNNISNPFSVNSIFDFLKQQRKTNYETIAQYIGFLEDAYIIHRCERYNIKGKEILKGTVKFYLNDLSFKNYLYPGFKHGWGYLLENLIFLELLNHEYEVYVGHLKNKEIDFIAKKNQRQLYVQAAYQLESSDTREREYNALLSIADNYEKIIVSTDDIPQPIHEGVKNISAWDFEGVLA